MQRNQYLEKLAVTTRYWRIWRTWLIWCIWCHCYDSQTLLWRSMTVKHWYHLIGEGAPRSVMWQNCWERVREILVAVPFILLLGENLHIFYENKPSNFINNSTRAEHEKFLVGIFKVVAHLFNFEKRTLFLHKKILIQLSH